MTQRFNEIAEANLRIQNPLTEEKLLLLGEVCGFKEGDRLLDLACGKGEAIVQWARNYSIVGVGVDSSQTFIDEAKERAYRLDVGNKVSFVVGNPADYPEAHHQFDYVSYLGSDWLAETFVDRIKLMRSALKPQSGTLLIGETFWKEVPDEAISSALGVLESDFLTLSGILALLESAGLELIEMVLADDNSTDRYEAQQWTAVSDYLLENNDDGHAAELRSWIAENRRTYLSFGRKYLGWGVFVVRGQETAPIPVKKENPDRPIAVDLDNEMLWVSLADGRIIGNPLAWYPWLTNVEPDKFNTVELSESAIYWPKLDQQIRIHNMLRGKR